jgi:hypothetical protein
MTSIIQSTPGVYINEFNEFPNAVVPVPTAVPAFIGYTPVATYNGNSYYNKAQRITSFADFQEIYMLKDPPTDPAKQYSPEYYLVPQKERPTTGDYLIINRQYYSILPDPTTIYYLYNSVRLFYQNGGRDAYIIAVGPYGHVDKRPLTDPSVQVVSPNVQLTDLQRGLALLQHEQEPTMYICPEATLLSLADNGILMQSMLQQAVTMQTAVCVFDIIGGTNPDPINYTVDIQNFRDNIGDTGLNYGVCYYPFIGTTIMQSGDIDFTNLFGGDTTQLQPLLNSIFAPNPVAGKILDMIEKPPATNPMSNRQLHVALLISSPLYAEIVNRVINCANVIPASSAIAGLNTVNDNLNGVWSSLASTGVVGVSNLPLCLSDSQQRNLNMEAPLGKSINAICSFPGQGVRIWGARTLDGDSQDWRYVSVRRTMIYLEQSIKLAARAYVFQPNDVNTWAAVKSMISNFLTNIWEEGGLKGASAADAFQVSIGLGSTMTAEDLLNGYMCISVQVALVRPAEFIVITFQQQQQAT